MLLKMYRNTGLAFTMCVAFVGCRQRETESAGDQGAAPQIQQLSSELHSPPPTNNMHADAWQQIVFTLIASLNQLKAKEAEVSDLEVFDPPPAAQIDELEREIAIKLPEAFRQFLAITGGFRFDWSTGSAPFEYINYGGNSEVDFLRASEELTLAQAYRYFQESYDGYEVEDDGQIATIRRCFPLYLGDLAGNALAVRLDTDPLQVHLLKAELTWHISDDPSDDDRSLVGLGLPEFLLHWALLGGPATENLSEVVEACGGETLDANSAAGRAVREWLAAQE